jgi:hypothetical protein
MRARGLWCQKKYILCSKFLVSYTTFPSKTCVTYACDEINRILGPNWSLKIEESHCFTASHKLSIRAYFVKVQVPSHHVILSQLTCRTCQVQSPQGFMCSTKDFRKHLYNQGTATIGRRNYVTSISERITAENRLITVSIWSIVSL